MDTTRKGDSIQTYTGREFWPLDPRPEEIDIDDIAHALSLQCRYGGHCLRFYSVAEHCILIASKAPAGFEMAALMHDASEAYLVDVPRPVKVNLGNYKEIEGILEQSIAMRFGLPWPMPPEVKRLDEAVIADERAQNMKPAQFAWSQWKEQPPLGVELQFWDPSRAMSEFLIAFRHYGGR